MSINANKGLKELAQILTNNNKAAVKAMATLEEDKEAFIEKHEEWCEMICEDVEGEHETLLQIFAYWLVGYEADEDTKGYPAVQLGSHLDWKADINEIITELEWVAENLEYSIEFDEAEDDELMGEEAVKEVSKNLEKQGYQVVQLDTDSDCFHLFIIKKEDESRLFELGKQVEFKFIVY